jgi:hypothetical protein
MSESWDKVKKFISDAAPILGSVVGGPAGAAAGAMISSVLGVKNDPDEILRKLESDPEALIKLRTLESEERKHLLSIQMKTLDLELADVKNAREAHKGHWMPATITIILGMMSMLIMYALVYMPIPENNRDLAINYGGVILGLLTAAVTYWIGTSRSSHDKTKLLSGIQ